MKRCTKCGVEKPIVNFGKAKSGKNGLKAECKDCLKQYHNQYVKENKESLVRYHKQYGIEYREKNKELLKTKWSNIYTKNKEKILEYHSVHYQKADVKNRHKLWLREWRKNNKNKVQVYKLKRRTLEKELPSTLTNSEWENCKETFDKKCAYCGTTGKAITLDHFYPLSKGGELSIQNSIPSCLSCNSSKGAKPFEIWYPKYKHYSKKRESTILKFLNYKNGIQQLALL